MKPMTKEELVFLWLVAFGYKARVFGTEKVTAALGMSPFHVFFGGIKVDDEWNWYIPDEHFDEVLGVKHETND